MENNGTEKKRRDPVGVKLHVVYLLFLALTVFIVIRLAGIQLSYKPSPKLADVSR